MEIPISTARTQLLSNGWWHPHGGSGISRWMQRPRGSRKVESRKERRERVLQQHRLCERYDVGIQLMKARSVWPSRPSSGSRLGLLTTLRLTHALTPIKAYATSWLGYQLHAPAASRSPSFFVLVAAMCGFSGHRERHHIHCTTHWENSTSTPPPRTSGRRILFQPTSVKPLP